MKDSDPPDEHLRCMKKIIDQLAAIKVSIPEDEHIVALLLSPLQSLTAKGDELSLAQVHQALASEEEKRGRKPIRCFRCGEENHVIRNCPKRRNKQYEYRNKPGNRSKH